VAGNQTKEGMNWRNTSYKSFNWIKRH